MGTTQDMDRVKEDTFAAKFRTFGQIPKKGEAELGCWKGVGIRCVAKMAKPHLEEKVALVPPWGTKMDIVVRSNQLCCSAAN